MVFRKWVIIVRDPRKTHFVYFSFTSRKYLDLLTGQADWFGLLWFMRNGDICCLYRFPWSIHITQMFIFQQGRTEIFWTHARVYIYLHVLNNKQCHICVIYQFTIAVPTKLSWLFPNAKKTQSNDSYSKKNYSHNFIESIHKIMIFLNTNQWRFVHQHYCCIFCGSKWSNNLKRVGFNTGETLY